VFYRAEPWPPGAFDAAGRPGPGERERLRRGGALRNFGFERVERLPGNVGYLDLRGFADPALAGDLAAAAMTLLAEAGALIVDLRRNGGGSPAMIALLSSYLFDEPTHLNDLRWREGPAGERPQQFWTQAYVPGRRFGGAKPVYVLTSGETFSGAEEFAYNLQSRRRATLVGATTRGGAHPGGLFPLDPPWGAHVAVAVPTGRAINPVTGTNWEGSGVAPDVAVPPEAALRWAHADALRKLLAHLGEAPAGPLRELADEARTALAAAAQ
jgi:retinol-binding protein 3